MAKATTKKAAKKKAPAKKAAAKKTEEKVEVVSKTELIEQVAEMTEESKRATTDFMNATIDAIIENVAEGKHVQLKGFTTYGSRINQARTGRNPQTGEEIEIAAQPVTFAKIGREFKRAVKENYKG